MSVCTRIALCLVCLVLIICGCSEDPNEAANKLFVDAYQSFQKAQGERGSYSVSYKAYVDAQTKLNQISSQYPTTNIAVSLLSGQAIISDFTLNEFNKVGKLLKTLSEAEQQPLSYALLIANNIEKQPEKDDVLSKIAWGYAEAGLFPQALEVVNEIASAYQQAYALSSIAEQYFEKGQSDRATELLYECIEKAKTIEEKKYQAGALTLIGYRLVKIGQIDKGNQLLSDALEMAKHLKDNKVLTLSKVMRNYASLGLFPQAADIADIADITDNKDIRVRSLVMLAGEFNKVGLPDKTNQTLANASKVASTFKDGIEGDYALTSVAKGYAEAGQFYQAFQTAKAIADTSQKGLAFSDIAISYAEIGQFTPALSVIRKLKEDGYKSRAWTLIAGKYFDAGQTDMANQLLSESLRIANNITYDFARYRALSEVANGYAKAGNTEKALELLSRAIETAKDSDDKAKVVIDFAKPWMQLNGEDTVSFRSMVHSSYPMKLFWHTVKLS